MTETGTYTVALPDSLYHCPEWWKNFINGNTKDFDEALADFNAIWIEEDIDDDNYEDGYRTDYSVEFTSHADYTWFRLRWA